MSFFQILTRLLEPIHTHRTGVKEVAIQSLIVALSGWLTTELFRRMMIAVQEGTFFVVGWKYALVAFILFTFFDIGHRIIGYQHLWYGPCVEIERAIMHKYISWYILLDNEETTKRWVGKIIGVVSKWVKAWYSIIFKIFSDILTSVLWFCFMLVIVGMMDIRLLPIVVGFTILTFLTAYFFNEKIVRLRHFRRDAENKIDGRIVRVILEKFSIMKHNGIHQELNSMDEILNTAKQAGIATDKYLSLFVGIPQYILNVMQIAAVIAAVMILGEGKNTMVVLSTFFIVIGILRTYIRTLTNNYKDITDSFIYIEKLWETFDSIPKIEWYDTGADFSFQNGAIELRNITAGYKEGTPVFQDFSLSIPGGKKLALVGRSWVGKSTLIKLIMGFIRPNSGQVLVDNQDLRDVSLRSYYPHIGYLSQEPAVFDASVLENLTYGIGESLTANNPRIISALSLAQCDFVYQLPHGLETEIGEKWVRLSGGERQRLAIAKLFLEQPEIIILDEPTSALDSFSEAKISSALHELARDKTLIVIAHRLQTVKEADTIVVLGPNTILEQGTHDELLVRGGVYAGMVDLQSGKIREG